jgi:preprotein translocase subunit SecG
MVRNLKMFERLGYASAVVVVLQLPSMRGLTSSWGEIAVTIVTLLLIGGGLVWVAARGHKWAGWLLVLLLILRVLGDIGAFWSGGPAWFQGIFGADASDSILSKVISLLGTLLLAAALYFYFLAAPAPAAASTTRQP